MQRFTVLAIDHTKDYVHHADPSLKSYTNRVNYGSVRNKREHRCEHGFLCDPEPGPGAVWLCPRCRRPWGVRRHVSNCVNNGASRIVAEALKKKPKNKQELYELVGGRLSREQVYSALNSIKRSGSQIPHEIWSPRPRRSPDEAIAIKHAYNKTCTRKHGKLA